MQNKRGQFYLISAIVIVAVIIGFAGVSNYSKKEDYEKINYLRDELQIETGKVVDYMTYNELNDVETNWLLGNVTKIYSDYSEIENLYFIFGDDKNGLVSWYLESVPESLAVDDVEIQEIENEGTESYSGDEVEIEIDNIKYKFELEPGMNFYFIISKGGYVATNA